jgi:hypothetical protein
MISTATKTKPMKTAKLPSTRPSNGKPGKLIEKNVDIKLPGLNVRTTKIRLVSTSGLIVLRFSEKAQGKMLAKHTGEASAGQEDKDPVALFKDAAYKDEEGFLFPSVCFKAACVSCANDVEQKQTEMRRAFHVTGDVSPEFARIQAPPITTSLTEWDQKYLADLKWEHAHGCSMRMDPVRNANGGADLRFRAFFPTWAVDLLVEYNANMISLEQLTQLFVVAGFGNGVGEWRVGAKQSKTGTFGRWKVHGM